MDSTFLLINSELVVPLAELQYRFARSGGPGGQHVMIRGLELTSPT
jgi:protein subunit release factor B